MDDVVDEKEVLAPDRLIQSQRDRRALDILGRGGFDVDDVEDRIADAVNADEAFAIVANEGAVGKPRPVLPSPPVSRSSLLPSYAVVVTLLDTTNEGSAFAVWL